MLSSACLRLLPAGSTRHRKQRVIAWGAVTLTCIGAIAAGPETVRIGSPALAQATSSAVPPNDAPVMRLGERVLRPFGWIEIKSFTRSNRDKDTEFKVEYLVFNNGDSTATIRLRDFFRLVVDGVPRSPSSYSGSRGTSEELWILRESAEDGDVTFTVRGRPSLVHLQLGTGDEGRSFLRWPD
jgi:hypothetical protein